MSHLEKYLEAALAAWEPGELPPEPAELRELAVDAGMTEAESEEAHHRALEEEAAAEAALKGADLSKARDHARRSFLLSPVRWEPIHVLAKTYEARFVATKDDGDRLHAMALARYGQRVDPGAKPLREMIDDLSQRSEKDMISWKQAAMIVFFLVAVSGTMTFCANTFLGADVTPEETEDVRRQLEEAGPPER